MTMNAHILELNALLEEFGDNSLEFDFISIVKKLDMEEEQTAIKLLDSLNIDHSQVKNNTLTVVVGVDVNPGEVIIGSIDHAVVALGGKHKEDAILGVAMEKSSKGQVLVRLVGHMYLDGIVNNKEYYLAEDGSLTTDSGDNKRLLIGYGFLDNKLFVIGKAKHRLT